MDISLPCQFAHVTQLKQSEEGILAMAMVDDESVSSEDGTVISKWADVANGYPLVSPHTWVSADGSLSNQLSSQTVDWWASDHNNQIWHHSPFSYVTTTIFHKVAWATLSIFNIMITSFTEVYT